jgi:DNA-binding beta-propeller fold protein YncE
MARALMLCILCATGYPAARAAVPAFAVIDRIPGGDGGYDYVCVDSTTRTVFVGRTTGVMRIDLETPKVTMNFVKGEDVAAVLIIPGTSLMLSTNGESNTATLFDRNSGSVKARIPTGKGPDGALYDTASKLAFVMNGDGNPGRLSPATQCPAARSPRVWTLTRRADCSFLPAARARW